MNQESILSYPNNKQENWVAYRNSEKFKKAIIALENLSDLGPQTKVVILSVALNIKQAGEFIVSFDQVTSNQVEQMLSDLGIYFFRNSETEKREVEWNKRKHGEFGSYVIGATPDAISEAIEAFETFGSADYHTKLGTAMEFPPTAIEAFDKSLKTNNKELLLPDDNSLTDEEKAFSFFAYSKDNWQKEVEFIEQIIHAVKEYSPKIYTEAMHRNDRRYK